MIGWIIAAVYGLPIVVRLGTHIHGKTKAKKEAIKNLEDMGYDVDKNYIKYIFDFLDDENFKVHQENVKGLNISSIVPFANFISLVIDIVYLFGNRTFYDYDMFSIMSEDKIEYLLKNNIISENKEKQLYLRDYNNALKELEKKYDEMPLPKAKSVVIISEEDSMDELYEKLERLQEMILRKQSSNNEINTDNNTLKYENKEGNKDERVKQ